MEANYFTSHVAKKTGIHSNMIREYSRILEMNGYSIRKDAHGKRCYTLKDVRLLQKIHREQRETLIELDELIAQILEETNAPALTPIPHDMSVSIQEQAKKMEEFLHKMNRIAEQNNEIIQLNRLLLEEHKRQDNKLITMEETMAKRSHKRDDQLMRIIRDLQVAKRSVAATKERTWVKSLKGLFVKQP
jgi:DNA-binding transcriptional MerR regulator